MPIMLAFVAATLIHAWVRRNSGDITAEYGRGYYYGIGGALMMLILLAYPLRKRLRAFRFLGAMTGWFRAHMILGVFGPTLIILHSNFSLGSLNSTVAMAAMLVIVLSGFIGRFLYARIHLGLFGHKQSARAWLDEAAPVMARMKSVAGKDSDLFATLVRYDQVRTENITGFWHSFFNTLTGPFSRSSLRRKALIEARRTLLVAELSGSALRSEIKRFDDSLQSYFRALARAEAFTFYERLFAAWHLLHLPLFIILVLATVAHVIAVHLY
jgi:hypothetical protein